MSPKLRLTEKSPIRRHELVRIVRYGERSLRFHTGSFREQASEIEVAVRSDDIVSAAIFATSPLIWGEWLRPGSHGDLISGFTPTTREAYEETDRQSSIYVDTFEATHEAVDLVQPIHNGPDCRFWVRNRASLRFGNVRFDGDCCLRVRSQACQELSFLAALSIAKERERAQRVGQLDCTPGHVFGDGQSEDIGFRRDRLEDRGDLLEPHPALGHLVIGARRRVRIVEQEEVVERGIENIDVEVDRHLPRARSAQPLQNSLR
jgi:hypothetical protein